MALDLADNPATNAAGEVLTKKYGPLPLWAWLLVVTGTVYGVKKFQDGRRSSQAVDDTDAATVGSSATGTGALVTPKANASGGGSIYGGGSLTSANTGSYQPVSAPETNQDWLNRALANLSGQGKYDSIAVQNALQAFINGFNPTDPTQRAIISDALSSVGGPPQAPGNDSQGGGTPLGGDAEVERFIRPADSPAVYAQYSDGTVRWIQSPTEMEALVNSNPAALRLSPADGGWGLGWRVQALPQSDPIFQRAILGVSQSEFDGILANAKKNNPLFTGVYHNR